MRGAATVLLAGAGALVVAACGESGPSVGSGAPTPTIVDAGAAQPYQLYTKCGVTFTQFNGVTWFADPPLTDGHGGPPPGFGNPTDKGTLRQVGQHELQYVSSGGKTATFVDRLPAGQSPPGLCD